MVTDSLIRNQLNNSSNISFYLPQIKMFHWFDFSLSLQSNEHTYKWYELCVYCLCSVWEGVFIQSTKQN